ncbi:hypothetical protein VKT23_006483 [Stygiomarasmius scandens]|uniref:Thioredoxin domain-containing protein n=1 Tax=Marasmiellus scandens TaxID=2682957 RepID=A0ABR1JQR9_9AGAR
MGGVTPVTSLSHFNELTKGDTPVVFDFFADWCQPCKMIAPVFEKLAGSTHGVGFYKVNTDELGDVAQECGITAIPTFILFHKGKKIDECKSANPGPLQQLVTAAASLVSVSAEGNTDDGGKHTDGVTESSTVAASGGDAGDDGGAAAAAAAAAAAF